MKHNGQDDGLLYEDEEENRREYYRAELRRQSRRVLAIRAWAVAFVVAVVALIIGLS